MVRAHRPQLSGAEQTELARIMLRRVEIPEDRITSFPHELSGGMKQRVAIAIALVLEPDVIIMDEPTTALDLLIQREVLEQIMALRDEYGFAIIFTTHDLSLLLEVSDSVAVMRLGRLVEYGPALEVYTNPGHPYTEDLLSSLRRSGGIAVERAPCAPLRSTEPQRLPPPGRIRVEPPTPPRPVPRRRERPGPAGWCSRRRIWSRTSAADAPG